MIRRRYLYFLLIIPLLWGCDGSTELPPERPFGTINGNAVAGVIAGAQVSIYGFNNGTRGKKLGDTSTDNQGAYSIGIQGANQAILIEISGGGYIEEATGTNVTLKDDQTLRAVGMYTSGETHTFMVTPLTHMVAALTEYKISIGMSAKTALAEASSTVNQFFALDATLTLPIDITQANSGITVLGDDVLYGFYLAGLSHWSLWASNQNLETQPHTTYNSIALSQVIYHDIRSDGFLNGIGFNQAGTELEILGFGVVPLNGDVYRLAFSAHMLEIAHSTENKTVFTINDLLTAAENIAAQTTLLVGASSPVDIDNQAPTFTDNMGTHSQARFSNNDGTYTLAELMDSNDSANLYFETDNVELGSVLISRQTLDSNTIPYFAFSVSDESLPGIPAQQDEITVRIQYRRNNQVLNPWHDLAPVNGEYLIPLASETLAANWHQSTPLDEHLIEVQAIDLAGNQATRSFTFKADFYAPELTIDSNMINDLGADIFSTTAFANREDLNNMQFVSTDYSFINTFGKPFYLNLSDNSTHTTIQSVEQLVREHLVNLKTATEWRLGLMTVTDECPDFDPVNDTWEHPTSVLNWDGSNWVAEQIPQSTYDAPVSIFSDTLPTSPSPQNWSDVPHFDQQYKITAIDNSPISILTIGYDYIITPSITPQAGYLFTWVNQDLGTGTPTACPQRRYFQQREVYSYESVSGYPAPVLSTIELPGTPDFSTISFTVFDNDTGMEITATNGWYLIPVGHSITIQKWVETPSLTLHNDDISDVSGYSSYTPSLYDKTMTWSVERNLNISIVHDAGEGNITLMPARNLTFGENTKDYLITR